MKSKTEPGVTLRRWTRAEYDRMIDCGILDEDEHVQLIAGEIVQMAAHKSPHATSVVLGGDLLRSVIGPHFHVRTQLPLALDPDSEPEPDLAVVAGEPRAYRDGHPTTAALVVEVADTTLTFDRRRKGSLYARAGILDCWIVNLVNRVLEVYRSPVVDASAPLGYSYRERSRLTEGQTVTPLAFPAASIAVADLLP
jgi:Uma2 family endonuclease